MASSWEETQPPPPYHGDHEDHYHNEGEDNNGDEEWLQLGLGLKSSSRSSTSSSWKTPQDHRHQDDHEINATIINMMMNQTTPTHHHVGPSNYPASIISSTDRDHHYNDHDHDYGHAAAAAAASGSRSFLGVQLQHSCHESQFQMMAVPAITTHNSISLPSSSSNTTTPAPTPTPTPAPTPTPMPNPTGLWFTLRSSFNRELGEQGQALPQIPKAYIRVKDENVTIFMVKKYLVRKLGLSNETEIDIWCMGQNLMHTQTLKQVRDGVWLPRLVESVNSAAAAAASFKDDDEQQHFPFTFSNHLMSLHYGRRYIFK